MRVGWADDHMLHLNPQVSSPAHPGWSVDVAGVESDLQGAEHCRQNGGHKRGCQIVLLWWKSDLDLIWEASLMC